MSIPWVIDDAGEPTWNPYTMPSPWPYTLAQHKMVVETYRVVRADTKESKP